MFGRARREYRVYAEDRFLAGEDLDFEDAPPGAGSPAGCSADAPSGVASADGWPADPVLAESAQEGWSETASPDSGLGPRYTAPRKRVPGRGSRAAGVAGVAAVAMALSAILVHTLRPAIVGGGASRPSAAVDAPAAGTSATRGARRLGGATTPARVYTVRPRVPASAVPVREAGPRRPQPGRVADASGSAWASTGAAAGGAVASAGAHVREAGEGAPASAGTPADSTDGQAVAPAGASAVGEEQAAPPSPEFGFER